MNISHTIQNSNEEQYLESSSGKSHEVYKQFYAIYGAEQFIDPLDYRATLKKPLVDGRVLHFDEKPDDKSIHLIVRQKPGISRCAGAEGFTYITYPENSFVVATTDGQSITRWNILSERSIVDGIVDGVSTIYDPQNCKTYFELSDDTGRGATLVYNSTEGNGTMEIDHQLGWILNEHDSHLEKQVALQQIPDDVGHAALELTNTHWGNIL